MNAEVDRNDRSFVTSHAWPHDFSKEPTRDTAPIRRRGPERNRRALRRTKKAEEEDRGSEEDKERDGMRQIIRQMKLISPWNFKANQILPLICSPLSICVSIPRPMCVFVSLYLCLCVCRSVSFFFPYIYVEQTREILRVGWIIVGLISVDAYRDAGCIHPMGRGSVDG